jgi:cytochrome c oxidase subunit 2
MTRRRKDLLAAVAVWTAMLVRTATAQESSGLKPRYSHWWLPATGTATAGRIDDLFYLILWISGIVLVLVFATLITFLIRYRRRPGARAIYSHGSVRLEIIWTVVPAIILLFLAVFSYRVWSEIKVEAPAESRALVIEVLPRQFRWEVHYPGADTRFGTADDVNLTNEIHAPAGRDVLIKLRAQDVIHSFFVPEFRVKQDAVPGMETRTWFNVPKPGEYEIACAELCGSGHYQMRGRLIIQSPEEYERWYAGQSATFAKTAGAAAGAASDTTASRGDSSATH